MISILGIISFIAIAFLFSENKKNISLRVIVWGLGLQALIAFLALGIPAFNLKGFFLPFFELIAKGFLVVIDMSNKGADFVFGPLAREFSFFITLVSNIVFLSSIISCLYYWGVMQKIISAVAWVMTKTMRLSGPETLSMAANIFVGSTEAPLLVRPYLKTMRRSEIFCIMVGGMATVAGTVMAVYISLLKDTIPNIGEHLLIASLMSAPAALLIAKILIPDTPGTVQASEVETVSKKNDVHSSFEAIAVGAKDGLFLALNIVAMLIAFIALDRAFKLFTRVFWL